MKHCLLTTSSISLEYAIKPNLAKISYASRVVANFVPNFVAMATRGRGRERGRKMVKEKGKKMGKRKGKGKEKEKGKEKGKGGFSDLSLSMTLNDLEPPT